MNKHYLYIDRPKYLKMLGIYITERREQLKISLQDLSKATGIAAKRLERIETGDVLIRMATFENLKCHLDLDEAHLEKIREVAKISFADKLYRLINQESGSNDNRSTLGT